MSLLTNTNGVIEAINREKLRTTPKTTPKTKCTPTINGHIWDGLAPIPSFD